MARLLVYCIAFQTKVCRWVTGDPPANATLQCSIALQHCIAALDCKIGLQYCTAALHCSVSLQNCIAALHCSSQNSLSFSRIILDSIRFSEILSDCTNFAASHKHLQCFHRFYCRRIAKRAHTPFSLKINKRFAADQWHFKNAFALLLQTCDKSWWLTLGAEMRSCV